MPNLTQAKKGNVTYNIKDATAREDITNAKNALINYDKMDVVPLDYHMPSAAGLTVTWTGNKVHIQGTSTGQWTNNFYANSSSFPEGIGPGSKVMIHSIVSGSGSEYAATELHYYKNGSWLYLAGVAGDGTKLVTIPSDAVGLLARLVVYANRTVNVDAEVHFLSGTLPLQPIVDYIRYDLEFGNCHCLFNEKDVANASGSDMSITKIDDYTLRVRGTTTAYSTAKNIYLNASGFPDGIKPGGKYWAHFESTEDGRKLGVEIYFYINGSWPDAYAIACYDHSKFFTVPQSATGMLVRCRVVSSESYTYDANIEFGVFDSPPQNDFILDKNLFTSYMDGPVPAGTDFNTLTGNAVYIISDSGNYSNCPVNVGYLVTYEVYMSWRLQIAYHLESERVYKRTNNRPTASGWSDWVLCGGGGGDTYNITKEISNISNTYNVTASPTITADTNNYLASTGDSTDRTSDIATMLATNKICNLGPGMFYVRNLTMPTDTAIHGSGESTVIFLDSSVTDGYAIKMQSDCEITNCRILGDWTDFMKYKTQEQAGTRYGIVWEGLADQEGACPYRSMVSNVWIKGFSGAGMHFYNTGYTPTASLLVMNAWINYCYCGIDIAFWSEFNRFTNVGADWCHIGCIDNGGNNVFTNCSFCENIIGVLMDNTEGDKRNNSHGSFVGCTIDHSGNNSGYAIKAIGMNNGEVISGLQMFYGIISLTNCTGFTFTGGEYGRVCTIEIDGGGMHIFADGSFQAQPTINITNNNKVKFDNCWTWDGVAVTR